MKSALKYPTLLSSLILFMFACQSSNKFTTGNEKKLAEILETYSQHPLGTGFTIVSNQPSGEASSIGPPATWLLGHLSKVPPSDPDPSGSFSIGGFVLRSPATGTDRYWSTRRYAVSGIFHPFDPTETDRVMLEIRVTGNDAVQITLFKEEANGTVTNFPVEIYGYLNAAQGHLIYGRYGGFNGLITISLWKALPVVG